MNNAEYNRTYYKIKCPYCKYVQDCFRNEIFKPVCVNCRQKIKK